METGRDVGNDKSSGAGYVARPRQSFKKSRAGQTIAKTRALVRAFFDGTVRGDWADLKELAGEGSQSQPDITVHLFGRMWP